jgi:ADP-ribose pyrophosphatase YjhB (NUDIX family)
MPYEKSHAARAASIIIHNNSILFMYREKNNKAYYAFPGGTVENNEKPEDTVLREVYEETSLYVNLVQLLYHIQITNDSGFKDEYFYLCDYVSGTPQIQPDAVEQQRMRAGNNYYELKWVPLNEIEKLLIYPLEIRGWLEQDLINGFSDKVREAKVARR